MKELMLQTQVGEAKEVPVVNEIIEPKKQEDLIKKKIEALRSMGFETAAKKAESAHKMVQAYGEYTYISQETINKFNQKLMNETLQEDKRARRYKKLVFTPIDRYGQIPPDHVLDKIAQAKIKGIFDRFDVGKIDWIEEIKDPIVFGRIDGCDDYFYIAQWDNDISIEELLRV